MTQRLQPAAATCVQLILEKSEVGYDSYTYHNAKFNI